MGKKPNLAEAFQQAESDAALNADVLTRLQQQKHKSAVEHTTMQERGPLQQSAIPKVTSTKPDIPKVEDELTVSLSTRVPKSLRQRLKRVSLNREEQRQDPWAIQHIVTQALAQWLDRNLE